MGRHITLIIHLLLCMLNIYDVPSTFAAFPRLCIYLCPNLACELCNLYFSLLTGFSNSTVRLQLPNVQVPVLATSFCLLFSVIVALSLCCRICLYSAARFVVPNAPVVTALRGGFLMFGLCSCTSAVTCVEVFRGSSKTLSLKQ